MKNLKQDPEKLIYVNISQTKEEKISEFKENVFSTIINSNYLNKFDKESYVRIINEILINESVLVPSLPIFRFNEEGNNDDSAKVFSFSFGVVNNDFEHGKFELLTVDEIKKYLNGNYWIFLYSISDEPCELGQFKFRTIILNKKSLKIDGNSNIENINADISKFSRTYSDEFKTKIVNKWENVGLIDKTKNIDKKIKLALILDTVEGILSKETDVNEYQEIAYQTVVYPIFVRLLDKIYLSNSSIPYIIFKIKNEYKNIIKDDTIDYELKFVENFVDNYINESNKNKHINALLEALRTGEPNDQTKLIVGLSKLHTAGFKEYQDLDREWLFSDYYEKIDNTLTKEEKELANEKAYEYFAQKNVKMDNYNEVVDDIEKILNYLSEFYDNKNPYPLMLFSENFDINKSANYDIDLINKYNTALNHPVIKELFEIYENYKQYYNPDTVSSSFKPSEYNKYFFTKQHKLIDDLIEFYRLYNFKLINSGNCHHIANMLLNRIGHEFDVKIFMEKYIVAMKHSDKPNFNIMFVEQFLTSSGFEPKFDLFK